MHHLTITEQNTILFARAALAGLYMTKPHHIPAIWMANSMHSVIVARLCGTDGKYSR